MPDSRFSIAGRNVIITGGSSGIGRTVAEQFAADGANVTICSRSMSDLGPVATHINQQYEGNAVAVECDVRDRDSVEDMVVEAVESHGETDILINNAGGDFSAPFEEISPNGWKAIIDVNLHGAFHCTQAVGEIMRSGDGGEIVNVASMYGLTGAKNHAPYGAAKAGLINLTEVVAAEWATDGIRVNAVAPGFIMTPGLEESVESVDESDISRDQVARRIGLPEEIADIIQFLASPAASFITGSSITARGAPDVESVSSNVERAEQQL